MDTAVLHVFIYFISFFCKTLKFLLFFLIDFSSRFPYNDNRLPRVPVKKRAPKQNIITYARGAHRAEKRLR